MAAASSSTEFHYKNMPYTVLVPENHGSSGESTSARTNNILQLAAQWVANISVYNPNVALELLLERIESMIFYKENDALAITSVDGFDLEVKEGKNLKMKFATSGYEGDQPIVEYPVLRDIEDAKKNGMVRFSMRLSIWTTYKAKYCLTWRRRFLVNPYCLGLNVRVLAGNGSLTNNIGGENSFCDVVVRLSDS
ncbi:uncharacterized protein LOC116142407 [Pistacia vera]|uniref:uncharacterized protein LOC116142407 n=1 Tax=Pistacia vera TaxID=55513 RepID=UPI00126345AF|nr:uncharacterized protein LOC116142407 [Pistacia vera]